MRGDGRCEERALNFVAVRIGPSQQLLLDETLVADQLNQGSVHVIVEENALNWQAQWATHAVWPLTIRQ